MDNGNITYTSTLPSQVMESISVYAKKYNLSKNKVIETALKSFLEHQEKLELEASLKRISGDIDHIEMAEWGINEYNEELKKSD